MALRVAVEPSPDREYDKRTPDLDAPTTTFLSGLIHLRSAWNRSSRKYEGGVLEPALMVVTL